MKLQQTIIYTIQEPIQGSVYQDFKFKFSYLSIDDYRRLIQNKDVQMVGFVDLNHLSPKFHSRIQVEIPLVTGDVTTIPCYKQSKGTPVGYLQVDEATFLCLERVPVKKYFYNKIITWLLVIALIIPTVPVFAKSFQHVANWLSQNFQNSTEIEDLISQNTVDWDGQLPLNSTNTEQETTSESIEIPGYADLILTPTQSSIHLINPGGNDVYFKYTIKQSETVLYETDLIEPGKMLQWNGRDFLATGNHLLTFEISTFNKETLKPNNGAIMTVAVTIK